MPKKTLRISIPKSPDGLVDLVIAIAAKHSKDGQSSPLNGMKEKDRSDFLAKAAMVKQLSETAKSLRRQAEKATQDRDLVIGSASAALTPGTLRFYAAAVRDLLVGVNKGNEQALGEYGFAVDTTPRVVKAKAPPTTT